MKVLFFTDHFYPEISAPAAHIYDRCKIWADEGHQVTVITNIPNYPLGKPYEGYKNSLRFTEILDGIKVIRVGTYMAENKGTFKRTLDYFSYSISSFYNSLFLERPDVVISTTPHIFSPLGAIAFSLLKRVPHVLEVRDLWPESIVATTDLKRSSLIYRLFEFIELFLYKFSERIIVFTQSFKANLEERFIPSEKIDLIINGANLSLFSEPFRDSFMIEKLGFENKFVIGYMGTHGLSHDLRNVIRAASFISDENIQFLFVGEGAEKELMISLATDLNLRNVQFIDRQPREEIAKFWGLCDLGLVHLKNHRVFKTVIPSKIFETMSAGKAIVFCGPEGDGSELITQHKCGIVVEPDKPELLARSIENLKNNPSKLKTLAQNGKKTSNLYSREVQARLTLETLLRSIKSYAKNG